MIINPLNPLSQSQQSCQCCEYCKVFSMHLFWRNCNIYRRQNNFPCFRPPTRPLCLSRVEPKHWRGHYTNSISSSRSLLFSKFKLCYSAVLADTTEKSNAKKTLEEERKHIERQWPLFIPRPLWTSVTPHKGRASEKSRKSLSHMFWKSCFQLRQGLFARLAF